MLEYWLIYGEIKFKQTKNILNLSFSNKPVELNPTSQASPVLKILTELEFFVQTQLDFYFEQGRATPKPESRGLSFI